LREAICTTDGSRVGTTSGDDTEPPGKRMTKMISNFHDSPLERNNYQIIIRNIVEKPIAIISKGEHDRASNGHLVMMVQTSLDKMRDAFDVFKNKQIKRKRCYCDECFADWLVRQLPNSDFRFPIVDFEEW
jgi:hypothetical protein